MPNFFPTSRARRHALTAAALVWIAVLAALFWSIRASAADGDLDTSFGLLGIRYVAFDQGGDNGDFASDIALDGNGAIYLAGTVHTAMGFNVAVARLTPNGTPDNAFNGNGELFVLDPLGGGPSEAGHLLVLSDNRVVVVGSTKGAYDGNALYSRVAEISTQGAVTSDATYFLPNAGSTRFLEPVALSQGRVGLAGWTTQPGNLFVLGYSPTAHTFAYEYGATGPATTRVTTTTSDGRARAAAYPDGTVMLAGSYIAESGSEGMLMRLTPAGALDTAFAPGAVDPGVKRFALVANDVTATVDVRSVVLDAQDRILVAGNYTAQNGASSGGFVARFNTLGALDSAFNDTAGFRLITGCSHVEDVAIDPLGRIYAVGDFKTGVMSNPRDTCITRITDGGLIDPTFGTAGFKKFDLGAGLTRQDGAVALVIQKGLPLIAVSREFNGADFDLEAIRLQDATVPLFEDSFE